MFQISLHPLPHFLLTRGLALTCALLLSAVALLAAGEPRWLALWYAQQLQSSAVMLLGAALIGPLLLEEILQGGP